MEAGSNGAERERGEGREVEIGISFYTTLSSTHRA